jgi:hypothetical protein
MTERARGESEDLASVSELAGPSIEDVLDDTSRRSRGGGDERPDPDGPSAALTLGEVVEECSPERPGRVLVRWLDERGRAHERWLRCVCGLALAPGDTVLMGRPANWNGWVVTGALQGRAEPAPARAPIADAASGRVEARVDGERVVLEGRDEVVLRCGEASIRLRRDGRVEIHGTRVETEALGTNRVKGAVVEIN